MAAKGFFKGDVIVIGMNVLGGVLRLNAAEQRLVGFRKQDALQDDIVTVPPSILHQFHQQRHRWAVLSIFGSEHIPADHVLRDHQRAPAQLALKHVGEGGLAAAGIAPEQDEFAFVCFNSLC